MRSIRLEEFLGDGQFGNVYKGIYEIDVIIFFNFLIV